MNKRKVIILSLVLSLMVLPGCKNQKIGENVKMQENNEDIAIDSEEEVEEIFELDEEYDDIRETLYEIAMRDEEIMGYIDLLVGKKATDLNLVSLEGEMKQLLDILEEENGLFIEFMGSWCPGCENMVSNINELVSISDKKVLSLALADKPEDLENFAIETNSIAEHYVIEGSSNINEYQVPFVPILLYIDEDGIIMGAFYPDTPDLINEFVNNLKGGGD